jgi:hypothetical protein
LYDWEQFEPVAPQLVDPIHFFLQESILIHRWRPSKIAKKLSEFISVLRTAEKSTLDVLLALAFLRVKKTSVERSFLDLLGKEVVKMNGLT